MARRLNPASTTLLLQLCTRRAAARHHQPHLELREGVCKSSHRHFCSSFNEDILGATTRLLKSVESQDFETYKSLCSPNLTAFEPEARGNLVEGLNFHEHYFNLEKGAYEGTTTISSPKVVFLGESHDVAVIMYVRLVQEGLDTKSFEETRVWEQKESGNGGKQWRHVHFHRSLPGH